ncbi:hypothetical protein QJS10_CPA03g00999 [Acorus calamus]|uniref:Apple domain-containing protein n=1 Tax=Acorus calamus TaxID=4465 RepID=A0AAV9F5W4_ACOCL|nr:hypothetical protein QJS10_CPA03g00999 [Acorus calamus]
MPLKAPTHHRRPRRRRRSPEAYETGFRGEATFIDHGGSAPDFKAVVVVEGERGKYSCSFAVVFGEVKVWKSNHLSRFFVDRTCELELSGGGDLRLKDSTDWIGWSSGTAGRGVEIPRDRNISYVRLGSTGLKIFDRTSKKMAQILIKRDEKVRFLALVRDVHASKACSRMRFSRNGTAVEMVEVEGISTVLMGGSVKNLSKEECADSCVEDSSCVSILYVDGDGFGKECNSYGLVGGVKQVERESGFHFFVKVSGGEGKKMGLRKRFLIVGDLPDNFGFSAVMRSNGACPNHQNRILNVFVTSSLLYIHGCVESVLIDMYVKCRNN